MTNLIATIVIRTRNEERWINQCLRGVFSQNRTDFEVVVVDNNSRDGTRSKVEQYPVELISYDDAYRPGRALNVGAARGNGRYLVFLSGHCIPVDSTWLDNLVRGFEYDRVAGVYGRQLPMSFSSAHDKRDLLISFGLDPILKEKDSFFHNANSAVRRDIWEEIPFDESVSNIEDRIWASRAIDEGYRIYYEPSARVYHHHGIHHGQDEARARSTVRVIEQLQNEGRLAESGHVDPSTLRIVALVPAQGDLATDVVRRGFELAISDIKQSEFVSDVVVLTDSEETRDCALRLGAAVPFLREPSHSRDYVDLSMVYSYYLPKLEAEGMHADLLVSVEPNYLQRPDGFIDRMIRLLLKNGHDTVVPVVKESHATWLVTKTGQRRVDTGDIAENLKEPLLVSMKGLGFVTHPEFVREGRLFGNDVGLLEVSRNFRALELRTTEDLEFWRKVIKSGTLNGGRWSSREERES